MAKYKKRADGRYRARVTIGYDKEGKPIVKSLYSKTIRELEVKLADFKSLLNKGVVITDNRTTLAEWAQKWLAAYKEGKSYNTFEMYEICVKKHIVTADIAQLPLNKIKEVDLQKLIIEKQSIGLTRTVEIIVLTLKQIFRAAVKNGLIYLNPAEGLKRPEGHTEPKRPLTDIENEAILKADLSERELAFIYLGKYAGLRRGEILALTKSDFDLKSCTVSVNKTVVFKKNNGLIKHCPKSDAGFRTIPMPDVLYDFIKCYLKDINGLCLFSMQDGGVCTKSSFRKLWDSILKKLNIAAGGVGNIKPISGLTPHILRHDYATNLYYAGVDIKTAQKLLGNNNIKMTLEIYTHLKQDNEDVLIKLNKRYEGQKRVNI